MTIHLALGYSRLPALRDAIEEATAQAREKASGPRFALVLATENRLGPELPQMLRASLGAVPWVAIGAPAVFCETHLLHDGVVVGLLSFSGNSAGVGVGLGEDASTQPHQAGQQAASRAIQQLAPKSRSGKRGLVLLSDILPQGASELVRGAAYEAGLGWAWAGGCTGTIHSIPLATRFAEHSPLLSGQPLAIAIQSTAVSARIHHGWSPYGPATMVTSKGALVTALDGEDVFEAYLRTAQAHGDEISREDFAAFAITHPLGIPQANGEHVIRDPLALEQAGLRFIAEVPDGCLVRVMHGNPDELIEAARTVAAQVRGDIGESLGGALIFDCISRATLLGDRLEHELEAFRQGLGPGTPFLGCLTFGEIGAFHRGLPQFHNKTVSVLGWSGPT